MTITRTKSPDWAVNEVLTSAAMNAVDANITNALDKRSGQSDTLGSAITMSSGSGFIVGSGASIQFASGSGFIVGTGTTFIVASSAAFSGTISFTNTVTHSGATNFNLNTSFGVLGTETHSGAANFTSTSVLTHKASSSEVYETGASIAFGSSAGTTVSGNITTSGTLVMWGTYGIASTALLSVAGTISCSSTSLTTFSSGSAVNFNGTTNVSNNLTLVGSGSDIVFDSPRNYLRTITSSPYFDGFGDLILTTGDGNLVTNSTGGLGTVYWAINLPHGSTLTSYLIVFQAHSSHTAVPTGSDRVFCQVCRVKLSDGTVTNFGSTNDNSVLATYEQIHSISPTSFSTVIDNNQYRYTLEFNNEAGADAKAGNIIYGASLFYTSPGPDSSH